MKKLLLLLLVLAAAAVLLIAGLIRYVQPQEKLDLHYGTVSIAPKITDMLRNRQLAFDITDEEMNNLLKKQLAESSDLGNGVEVTGAKFTRENERLFADVNVLYRGRWRAGVRLEYTLSWNDPLLRAEFKGAAVKGISIPRSLLDPGDFEINVNGLLPEAVGVKSVVFAENAIRVWLKLGR